MNTVLTKVASFLIITICLSIGYTPSHANATSKTPLATLAACEIFNVSVTPQPCTQNGVFFVEIDFDFAGDVSDAFTVGGNGNDYGEFLYSNLPITVGPLEGDGITIYEFVVTDLTEDCSDFAAIDPINCDVPGECDIVNLVIDPQECNDDGTYSVFINFEYENPGNDFFDLFDGNGNLLGFYPLGELPITYENYIPSGNDFDVITVCINDNPNCCATEEFPALDCPPVECNISNVVADPGSCDGSLFWVTLNFEYENTSNQFSVQGNGTDYGNFFYDDLPIAIGPLVGDGMTIYEFVVTDLEFPNCSNFTAIDPIQCDENDCEIWDLVVETYDCDGGFFLVDLTFNYANTSDSFEVHGNGNNYGTFAYDDLFITLGPFEGNGQALEFVVYDQQNDACAADIDLEAPVCPQTSTACVDFESLEDGVDYGYLEDGDTLTVENDIAVTVAGYNEVEFYYIEANISPFCGPFPAASGIHVFMFNGLNFDFSAQSTPSDSVSFDFHTCDPGGEFSVNGGDLTPFFYFSTLDTTFTLNTGHEIHIVRNPNVNYEGHVTITGEVESLTIQGIELALDNICYASSEPLDCEIWDLIAEAYDCDDNDQFLVDIDFNYQNTSDSFTVIGNGNNYGTFAYEDLFITLGPFDGNGQLLEFIVFDQLDDGCIAEIGLEAPNCGNNDCDIFELVIDPLECNDDGTYSISINFQYENPGNDFFDLYDGNGNLLGFYPLNELPIVYENFVPSGNNFDVITVCINDNPNCCATAEFEALDCPNDNCEIWDLVAEVSDCNPNDVFFVDIDFNHQNTSDSFTVIGNGNNYGTYAYEDLFITLGPFDGNGQVMEFIVFDQLDDACNAEVVLEAPNCGNNDCEIGELILEFECDNDEVFGFLDFEYTNTGDNFVLVINGDIYSIEAYASLPLFFGPLPFQEDYFVAVIDDDDGSCFMEGVGHPENCDDVCQIYNLIAETNDCDDNDQFLVDIDFNYQNTSDSFTVIGNGNNYGTFAYEDLFITLGPFDGNGQLLEFIVFDQLDDGCNAEIGLEAPNCGNNDCDIFELVIDPLECNDDGTYSISINFQYENPGNDFFDLYDGNGNLLGFYPLNELPIVYENFVPSGNNFDVITVCINDNSNCCATTEFEALDCEVDCQIYDFVAEAFCDGDDLYVEFSFETIGVGDSFTVLSCYTLGTFAYGEDTYVVQIPDDMVNCAGGIYFPFGIYDQNNEFCYTAVFVYVPDCYETGCLIGDVEAVISDCENGEFVVTLDFDFLDVSDEGFAVFGNGNDYGVFDYNELPITLGTFEGNGQEMEFIVVDLLDDECWNFTEIEAPVCTEDANTCIEFESLYNGVNYGGPNSEVGDLLLIENGVYVTIEGVVDPLGNENYDYLFATNQDICSPFEMASGIRMFMFNGLRFDFSELDENPTVVTFNYHNCGLPFAISVNDQLPVTYVLPENDYSLNLTPNVTVHFDVDENNTEEGVATFEGEIETLFAGGVEFQIDNVCFNVEEPFTEVWPGDANYDNQANHFDLLNVGIAFGNEGAERDIISNDWLAMPGEDWDDEFLNEANYKHADCNGDGIVNFDDKVAIVENYGMTHGEVPIFIPVEGTENDPALFVDLPEASQIELNEPFEAPIVLGTIDIPVNEIYGLAFTIEFDVNMMDEEEVHVELGSSWLGINGENLITLNKKSAPEGIIEVALTRNNQANIGGQGNIGYFIGIIDDILGKSEVEVVITGVKAITLNELPVPLSTPTKIVDISTSVTTPTELDLEVFPNPTDNVLNIKYDGTASMRSIKIYNTLGQLMTEFSEPIPHQKIDVSNWSAGVYIVKIEVGDAIFCEKIKVSRL